MFSTRFNFIPSQGERSLLATQTCVDAASVANLCAGLAPAPDRRLTRQAVTALGAGVLLVGYLGRVVVVDVRVD